MCGENIVKARAAVSLRGSSPRVRGKPGPGKPRAATSGLIPACAGKTADEIEGMGHPAAHPRVCGENLGEQLLPIITEGSSPRVRGKPGRRGSSRPGGRLIPACAGKTPQGC